MSKMVVYQKIRRAVRRGLEDQRKRVIVVKGGPGTGKSVLAVNRDLEARAGVEVLAPRRLRTKVREAHVKAAEANR